MAQRTRSSVITNFAIGTLLLIATWLIFTLFVAPNLSSSNRETISLNFADKLQSKYGFKNKQVSSSFWSKQNRAIAWEKFFNGTGTMILIHARKAAGTTMDKWLTSFINDKIPFWALKIRNISWQCSLIKIEAFTNVHGKKYGYTNFLQYVMNKYRFGIYVISLRDPIERIIHQYEFEWRWGCIRCGPQRSFMKYNKLNKMNKTTYMKKIDDSSRINIQDKKWKYANIDFHNFLDRIETFELNSADLPSDGKHVRSFGSYINNYYLYMFCCDSKFCNIYKDFEKENEIEKCYDNAIEKILSFDIVVISEWLNDIRIQLYVNKLLFGEMYRDEMFVQLTSYPFPHRIVDRGRNYMIHEQSKQRLLKWNKWDLKLYHFTKRLVYHRQHVLLNNL